MKQNILFDIEKTVYILKKKTKQNIYLFYILSPAFHSCVYYNIFVNLKLYIINDGW